MHSWTHILQINLISDTIRNRKGYVFGTAVYFFPINLEKEVANVEKYVKIDMCVWNRANKVDNVNEIRTGQSVENSQKNNQTKVLFRRN